MNRVQPNTETIKATPYKTYIALLDQTGTSNPTATIIKNTLGGDITWTRDSTGYYQGELKGAFTRKTIITFNVNNNCFTNATRFGSGEIEDVIELGTYDSAYVPSDGKMNQAWIEIRVYN